MAVENRTSNTPVDDRSSTMVDVDLGLFDTLVPGASIVTISTLVGFILPRYETLGLFLLFWWVVAVVTSLLGGGIFADSTQWSKHDGSGMILLTGFPAMVVVRLCTWFHRSSKLRRFVHQKLPLSMLFALNAYRLDGLSIILPLSKGEIPKYLGLQMILLDALIGGSGLMLAVSIFVKGVGVVGVGWRRDFVWFWNSLGLYDLVSGYVVLILNYLQLGGSMITQPPLTMVGSHPIPLILLFQAPLAIVIHLMLLTSLDMILQEQSGVLPLRIRRIRQQQ